MVLVRYAATVTKVLNEINDNVREHTHVSHPPSHSPSPNSSFR
jgi:hypothetical protein